jgi:Tripartite tricarboxylate transporter family receptor
LRPGPALWGRAGPDIKADKLRALAVTTAARFEGMPDIPTVGDAVPNYEASQWYGVGAPKNTPAEIVDKLNREINAALTDPNMKTRLAELGGTPLPGSPANFGKLIADDTEKWAKVVRASGARRTDLLGQIFHKSRYPNAGSHSLLVVEIQAGAVTGWRISLSAAPQRSRNGRGSMNHSVAHKAKVTNANV